MELFFDTETSDKFNFKRDKYTDTSFPWMVQLGAVLAEDGIAYGEFNLIIHPEGRSIAEGAAKVHKISTETAERFGLMEASVVNIFKELLRITDLVIAHNFEFDSNIVAAMLHRNGEQGLAKRLKNEIPSCCTMQETTDICKIRAPWGDWKWPKLSELYWFLFNEKMVGAHDAMFDIRATMRCYYELKERGLI